MCGVWITLPSVKWHSNPSFLPGGGEIFSINDKVFYCSFHNFITDMQRKKFIIIIINKFVVSNFLFFFLASFPFSSSLGFCMENFNNWMLSVRNCQLHMKVKAIHFCFLFRVIEKVLTIFTLFLFFYFNFIDGNGNLLYLELASSASIK